jgi:hypothetical protein
MRKMPNLTLLSYGNIISRQQRRHRDFQPTSQQSATSGNPNRPIFSNVRLLDVGGGESHRFSNRLRRAGVCDEAETSECPGGFHAGNHVLPDSPCEEQHPPIKPGYLEKNLVIYVEVVLRFVLLALL